MTDQPTGFITMRDDPSITTRGTPRPSTGRAWSRRVVGGLKAASRAVPRVIGSGAPVTAQIGGSSAALAGLYLLTGLAVTLIVGGLALVAVGTLAEMAGQPTRKGGQ